MNRKQHLQREHVEAARLVEAESLAKKVRNGDELAARQAREVIREGPTDEVRKVLKEALSARPATTSSSPRPTPPVTKSSRSSGKSRQRPPVISAIELEYLSSGQRVTVQGWLRRNHTNWVVQSVDGHFYAVDVVEEGQPGRLVGRLGRWLLWGTKRGVLARVDGDAVPWTEVREIPGGGFEQGKNRRH